MAPFICSTRNCAPNLVREEGQVLGLETPSGLDALQFFPKNEPGASTQK
jgi:hypothetical protein